MKKKLLSIFILSVCILLPTFSFAQTISAEGFHSLAVCSNNTAMAWGSNYKGQLGNGTNTDTNLAVQVSSLTGVIAIAGGDRYSLALKNDDMVWAWGENYFGQLGLGDTTDRNIPVQVTGLSDVIAISAGGGYGVAGHSLALKNDGTVWAWGLNNYGQLGNGTNTDSNIPIQVTGLSNVIAIAAGGNYHSHALKNDGTVWAWGYNLYGQLGNGTNIDTNLAVQVSSLTGITAIAAGDGYFLALKNDSTLWACGYNFWGQLGNGTNIDTNLAVQVSSLTGITSIAGGSFHSLALKNDGTIWAWGQNYYGQLGNGTNIDTNLAVQVSSLTGIISIAGGYRHSLALKNDGTAWAWGRNLSGQLGNGTNTDSNVPVQVTGLCTVLMCTASITGNTTICSGQNATLTASGGANYSWSTGGTNASVVVSPSTNTTYSVTSTTFTCVATASVTITVNNISASLLLVPDTANPLLWYGYPSITGTLPFTYFWDFGDGDTSTLAYPTHSYSVVGNYVICLTVTDNNSCTISTCDTTYKISSTGMIQTLNIVNPLTTGIESLQNKNDISIYPNPFSSSTTLQTDNIFKNASLTVYNCFGQTVAQIKNINGQTVVFSRDNLASGLYFVRLTAPSLPSPIGGGTHGEGSVVYTGKLVITDK